MTVHQSFPTLDFHIFFTPKRSAPATRISADSGPTKLAPFTKQNFICSAAERGDLKLVYCNLSALLFTGQREPLFQFILGRKFFSLPTNWF